MKSELTAVTQGTGNQCNGMRARIRTYLSTTTMGLSLPVRTIKPFHIMRAEDTIMAKFKTW